MRMKLAFAFGRIQQSEELVQPVYVEAGEVALRGGVTLRRLRSNVFEVRYGDERVEVDLNLRRGESYEAPYTLDNHLIRRDYFAVVHTGDGDGWDINRPAMGSLLLCQGKVYLVDAGPNIDHALTALGIGINEIDGIFHTHCHDDHLVGLTSLMRGDHRISYFAVPMVRASVQKKLAVALSSPESEFSEFFDVHDLQLGIWNNVDGLDVRPILSPHPVETTIFYFRMLWAGGYRTYAHLADTVSLDVLRKMIAPDGAPSGIRQSRYDATVEAYMQRADIKKIDVGGGMIHGMAADFAGDTSAKLILSHTSRRLTEEERAIGSGAPFGTVDVLIESASDTLRNRAFGYLHDHFPDAALHSIRHLMNNRIVAFNPEVIILKDGDRVPDIFLVVSGSVEMLRSGVPGSNMLSAGSLIGEFAGLLGTEAEETYRAMSFVQALRLPRDLYLDFVNRNTLYRSIVLSSEKREFLRRSSLFADGLSCATLNRLVQTAEMTSYREGEIVPVPPAHVVLLRSGEGELVTSQGYREQLAPGDYFGGYNVATEATLDSSVRFSRSAEAYRLPLEHTRHLPVVRWKLLETFRRRFSE
jgi:hemerythrin